MSGLKIGHTSVVFAAAIIVASCVTIVDGAESLPRGRARLNDAHTTFVADNGALLRGCVASHKRESLEQLKLVGLNAVHDYAEGCDLKYPAEGSRAPGYRVEAIDKAVKLTKELGLYFIMKIGNDPGKFNVDICRSGGCVDMTTVAIVDDHSVVRIGMKYVIMTPALGCRQLLHRPVLLQGSEDRCALPCLRRHLGWAAPALPRQQGGFFGGGGHASRRRALCT